MFTSTFRSTEEEGGGEEEKENTVNDKTRRTMRLEKMVRKL